MPAYYNAHIHVFNFRNTPKNFLSVKVPAGIVKIVNAILSKPVLAKFFLKLLSPFVGANGRKMLAFIKIGLKKTPEVIFDDLLQLYPQHDDVGFIILPLDFSYMNAGPMDKVSYEQQLEELFALKLKYPTKVFPFVAIDPRSDTAMNNLKFIQRYMQRGFSGIKLYPALGYFGYHPGLLHVYEYAADKHIPLLTHCSSGGINMAGDDAPAYLINPECFNKLPGRTYHFQQTGEMKDFCDYMNNPDNFEEVLHQFPTLKICFAHFGIDAKSQFAAGPGLAWYDKILNLMSRYENVYTDISYTAAYSKFLEWFMNAYQNYPAKVQERILYGTDFFMTLQEDNGQDNELLKTIRSGLGESLFLKLAKENVERFLAHDPLT